MKQLKLMLALCALAVTAEAQPWNGQYTYYNWPPSMLTSATYVNNNPGFIMAGYVPVAYPAYVYNLVIDKSDKDATLGAAGTFANGYIASSGGPGCNTTLTQETNAYGVSIIETSLGVSKQYALAASFDDGCIFAVLDNNGNTVGKIMYLFPGTVTNIKKPLITESTNNPGEFYVSGSYTTNNYDEMYVFKIGIGFNNLWNNTYNLGNGTLLQPTAIVETNASGTPELAIAGISKAGSTGMDGFFVTLKGFSGSVGSISPRAFDGFNADDQFLSISLSAANSGFIIGGVMGTPTPSSGHAWMMLMKPNGAIQWSKKITPATDKLAGKVVGVIERFNTSSVYEYYGACESVNGMVVLKLDANGAIFSGGNSEFLYDDYAGPRSEPVAISYWDNTSNVDNIGLHVFGNNEGYTPGQFFMVQAYFNGVSSNCTNVLVNIAAEVNAGSAGNVPFNMNSGLQQCPNVDLVAAAFTCSPNVWCQTYGNPGGGSNARTSQPTSLAELNANKTGALSVYPNPASNSTRVNYTVDGGADVSITLTDCLGRHIKTVDKGYKENGVHELSLNLSEMDLKSGVYFINVSLNGAASLQKIIYNKE